MDNSDKTQSIKRGNIILISLSLLALVIILFGSVLIFIQPSWWACYDLTGTGQIGDTIGGITAPILNLIGSILIFYSFREQLKANNLQIDSLKTEKERLEGEKEFDKIYSILEHVILEINDLSYDTIKFVLKTKSTVIAENSSIHYSGFKSIYIFTQELRQATGNRLSPETLGFIKEIYSILKSFAFGLQRITVFNYSPEDKEFLYQRYSIFYDIKLKDVEELNKKLEEIVNIVDHNREVLIEWHTKISVSVQLIKSLLPQEMTETNDINL